MNREEAAREIDNTACCFSDKRFRDAMHMAADALRGPQPDPKTGLVPCGCGGKAIDNDAYTYGWGLKCQVCGMTTEPKPNKAWAKDDWNTAMGWREDE